jgi:hypothetical protein
MPTPRTSERITVPVHRQDPHRVYRLSRFIFFDTWKYAAVVSAGL